MVVVVVAGDGRGGGWGGGVDKGKRFQTSCEKKGNISACRTGHRLEAGCNRLVTLFTSLAQ